LDATVENPFALEAPITQWLYKHLKERLRFGAKPARWKKAVVKRAFLSLIRSIVFGRFNPNGDV